MRLLKVQDSGNISITEDLHHNVPPYAILSHTWTTDDQEVTINDIREQGAQTKDGYRKIDFCRKQALKDGLQYFWVDTCCIRQSSDAELTRSINSMFRWYRDAEKCYVYLSDVSADFDGSNSKWDDDFRRSRWFTRGWTLQELIAPRSVEFFSSEGKLLGNKKSLEKQLHAITKIPVSALQGTPLSDFSIDERMLWSENRETKLAEDKAYCLFGIFDIHMPLIYGEGQEHAYRRLKKKLDGNSYLADRDMTADPCLGYQKREPFSTVPFGRDLSFVNRPEILAWIDKKCKEPAARAALFGIGGIGKSQIIIEYAYRVRHNQPKMWVFWVHASTIARVEEAYRGIADRLGLPGRHNANVSIFQLVSNWLCNETNGQWMLILDNVDDIEVFFPKQKPQDVSIPLGNYLPQSKNGRILITSRNMDAAMRIVGDIGNVMQVQAMKQSQARELLQNKLHNSSDEHGITELIHSLDHIPLALTQAAAYINRRARMSVSNYLAELRKNKEWKENLLGKDLGDLRRDANASNSVQATWHISFQSVREERPSAADLLSLLCFFHPQNIPAWVLRRHSLAAKTDEDNANAVLDDDIDLLQAFSLITAAADEDVYGIHALVQLCTRAWLHSLGSEDLWRQRFLSLMAEAFPRGEFQNRAECQQLLPHLELLYDQEPPGEEPAKEWAQVLTNAAWHLWRVGDYKKANTIAVKALKVNEAILGYDNLSTLTTMAVLALIFRGQGRYNEGESMNRQALEGYHNVLGEQHPDTLKIGSNLALVLRDQGKYDEAAKIDRRTLEGREIRLGPEHPDTLISVSSLALILRDLGKYDEAETLNRRALEGRSKVLGKQHPSTLTSASNLAVVLQEKGDYEDSEKLNRQVLEGREMELGERHPHTLMSRSNLALVLQEQGKYNEAEEMNRQVLHAYEKELGTQHPSTLTSVSNLASVLLDQGKYNEAEELNRRALEARKTVLGSQHPDSLTSLSNLAFTLRSQEKYDESEALHRQALEGREGQLGVQHPDTLTSVNDLALVLRDQQKYTEAERLSRRALMGHQIELGAQHPYTLTSLSNLASILQDQGKYDEAETMGRQAVKEYEDKLGIQHPDTLKSISNLASIIKNKGMYEEAEDLNRRVLEGREKQLGINHPETIKSIEDLASVLRMSRITTKQSLGEQEQRASEKV